MISKYIEIGFTSQFNAIVLRDYTLRGFDPLKFIDIHFMTQYNIYGVNIPWVLLKGLNTTVV